MDESPALGPRSRRSGLRARTHEEVHVAIGERIRAFRERQDMSLGQLAKDAKVSKGYLSALERGEASNPSVEALGKIARALDVSPSDLLEERPEQEGAPETLPPGLQEFLDRARERGEPLTGEDVQTLLNIRYRGRRPRDAEDWAYLFETLKRIIG